MCLLLCGCSNVPKTNTVSVALTGDLLFEQGLYDWMDDYQFGDYFDEVKPYLSCDLTIGNQEVPIGGEELGVSGVAYTFNAPYQIARQLPDVGFTFLTLANNHTMDMSEQGIINTRQILDEVGLNNTGMYLSKDDRYKIRTVDMNGIKISILAYTYGTNQPATSDFGVPYFLNEFGEFDDTCKRVLKEDIRIAKKISDVVIVAMHWGNEFTYEITDTQSQAAQFLNEQGVDLVVGNHPHCIQKAETLTNSQGKQTVVFYSLGNFVSSAACVDRASEPFQNMYEIGAIVNLDIEKNEEIRLNNIHVIPIVNHFEQDYQNFKLIPFSNYTDQLAQRHYQHEYSESFNLNYLSQQIHYVFDDSGFLKENLE